MTVTSNPNPTFCSFGNHLVIFGKKRLSHITSTFSSHSISKCYFLCLVCVSHFNTDTGFSPFLWSTSYNPTHTWNTNNVTEFMEAWDWGINYNNIKNLKLKIRYLILESALVIPIRGDFSVAALASHLIAHCSPLISSQLIIPSPFRLPSLQKQTFYTIVPNLSNRFAFTQFKLNTPQMAVR